MSLNNYILIVIIAFGFLSCKERRNTKISSELELDHFNIWVKNPNKAKEKLTNIGFTTLPDSLSQIHDGQGTTGKYFFFLNTYLEFIFVYDNNEFEQNNTKNKALDFEERNNFKNNGASPFGIALKLKNYNLDKIPFKKVAYHQDWMKVNENIYAAKNSKTNLKEPSIFIVYPELESQTFKTLEDLKNISEEYSFIRQYYKHPNGAQKVTKIKITSTNINLKTETIKAINTIEDITIQNGEEHVMEIYFDNNIQQKSFDLRPELPLIIYL